MTRTHTIAFLSAVNNDPKETFRKLAAFGVNPDQGLNGEVYTQTYGDKQKSAIQPDKLSFVLKAVFMGNVELTSDRKVIGSFTLSINRLNPTIPLSLTSSIPANIAFPQDGHLRWRTSAPITRGKLFGYLTHDNRVITIDPDNYGLDSDAIDMQVAFAAGRYFVHILTAKGTVYETSIKPVDVITTDTPEVLKFRRVKQDITALLTVPRKGELICFYGTRSGVYFGEDMVRDTKGLFISDLVVDSEHPRIFIRTEDNKIYALPVDVNFMLTGKIISINDIMGKNEQLFAGPAVKADQEVVGLLAIAWTQQNQTYQYQERVIAVPQLPSIPLI